MSQWANEHPEQAAEIAALPMREQNAALREAMGGGYDPDRIRDELEERGRTRPAEREDGPTRAQEDAVDEIAGRWGRARVEGPPAADGTIVVVSMCEDVEISRHRIGADGEEVPDA